MYVFRKKHRGNSTDKTSKNLGRNVMVINNSLDMNTDGEGGFIATHNRECEPCISADKLLNLIATQSFRDADVIIIEEAQFFSDLFDFVTQAVDNYNKQVIVSGLDGDS